MRSFFSEKTLARLGYPEHFTSCEFSYEDQMIGNVNIDNRIFTQGAVIKLGKDKYQIKPFVLGMGEEFLLQFAPKASQGVTITGTDGKSKQVISAEIDGVNYQGSEIIVGRKKVFVDGKRMTLSPVENKEITISRMKK